MSSLFCNTECSNWGVRKPFSQGGEQNYCQTFVVIMEQKLVKQNYRAKFVGSVVEWLKGHAYD